MSGHDVRPDLTGNDRTADGIPQGMPLHAVDATPNTVEHTRVTSMT